LSLVFFLLPLFLLADLGRLVGDFEAQPVEDLDGGDEADADAEAEDAADLRQEVDDRHLRTLDLLKTTLLVSDKEARVFVQGTLTEREGYVQLTSSLG
jgi:hypothetical protein